MSTDSVTVTVPAPVILALVAVLRAVAVADVPVSVLLLERLRLFWSATSDDKPEPAEVCSMEY